VAFTQIAERFDRTDWQILANPERPVVNFIQHAGGQFQMRANALPWAKEPDPGRNEAFFLHWAQKLLNVCPGVRAANPNAP
jgi:hypothetical protein